MPRFELTVIDTPTNVESVRTGEYTVQISWSAPASNTPPVAGYEVFHAESGSVGTTSGGITTSTSIIVSVPTLGFKYNFFVVAFSDADNTLPSAPSDISTTKMRKCNY